MEISDKIKEVRKENDELKERIKEQRDKMNDAKRTYFCSPSFFPPFLLCIQFSQKWWQYPYLFHISLN